MSLVQDPLKWSASMVSSWVRFWIISVFFVLALVYTVNMAASWGWQAAMGIVFFLAAFQIQILYALRRLFLKASGQDIAASDLDSEKRHFIWMIAVFIAAFIVLIVAFRLARGI